MKLKDRFKIAVDTWKMTFSTFKKNPSVLLPFLIVGLFDLFILALIYMAPRPPLSALLAPPIRAFWGERFLHYPLNLFLIPRLFTYGHTVSTAFIGVLMTGLAIGMLKEAKENSTPNTLFNLIKSIKMYIRLLVIWLVMFGLVSLVFSGLPFVFQLKSRPTLLIALYVSFLISIPIQAIFIYAMPAVVIEGKKTWPAIKRSISFSKEIFLPTLFLVAVPMLIFIPIMVLRGKMPILVERFFPETILIVLGLGIVISVVIDCLVTCSATLLFLNQRKA